MSTKLFPLLLLCCLVACNYAPPPKPVAESAASLPKTKAPGSVIVSNSLASVQAIELSQPDGKAFKFDDLKGKVLVIDVWATFCPPCRAQAPKLDELNRKYAAKGFAVVGLNIDEEKDHDLVKTFMKEVGINYTVAYASEKMSRAFLDGTEDETGAPPIPQTFIISRDGKVVEHLIGNDPRHTMSQIEETILKQLN